MLMRKFIFLLLLGFVSSCQNDKKINSNLIDNPLTIDGLSKNIKAPQISINSPVFDFGEVNEGEKLEHIFLIKNTGKANLVISSAKTTCGCTVAKLPKEPILPNQQSEIIVVFNTKGKFGKQNKTITLLTNTVPRAKVLTIKGYINKQ
tara:strand:+ start:1275 stop:1718 length:444 start_codon:yes stop_codon:yes gene_type:complete